VEQRSRPSKPEDLDRGGPARPATAPAVRRAFSPSTLLDARRGRRLALVRGRFIKPCGATIRMRIARQSGRERAAAGMTKDGRSPIVEIPAAAASAQVASSGGHGVRDRPSLVERTDFLPDRHVTDRQMRLFMTLRRSHTRRLPARKPDSAACRSLRDASGSAAFAAPPPSIVKLR
jgi:hypothetical protein